MGILDGFDFHSPLPSFDIDMPKINVGGFLPDFGNVGGIFSGAYDRLSDFSLGDVFFGKSGNTIPNQMNMPFQPIGMPFMGGSSSSSFTPQFSYKPPFSTTFPWTKPPDLSLPGQTSAIGSIAGTEELNQYNNAFTAAANAYGFNPNYLKAIAVEEHGWGDSAVSGAGALGIMQIMPGGYGSLEAMYPGWKTDPFQNIMLGAAILNEKRKEHGGDLDAATMAYLGSGVDPYTGVSTDDYLNSVKNYFTQLNQSSGGNWVPSGHGNNIVNIATQFAGVPYNWGSIPGAKDNPWQTGWDCSGFTWYMDQKYGNGTLPQGSHYQYQYALDRGMLFQNTANLRPGDLVFFDTGWMNGAGAELNRAGHVGIYLGNGKMIQAANESQGTIISNFVNTDSMKFLGAMHSSFSE